MAIETKQRGYKLRKILRRHPDLIDDLRRLRDDGASYHELALYIWDTARVLVDPTTVRKWLEQTLEQ